MAGEGCDFLELQVGESALFSTSVQERAPAFAQGRFGQPQGAGMGAALDAQVLAAHPYAPVAEGLDPSLG